MRSTGHLYRLAMAFLISIGLNVVLVAVDFRLILVERNSRESNVGLFVFCLLPKH
jgi:hypothetical protein